MTDVFDLTYEGTPEGLMEYIRDAMTCEFCHGTGEVSTMARVYHGEPHMADIGTEACVCQRREDFEE